MEKFYGTNDTMVAVRSIAANVLRLAEVPHSRNFGFKQELSCGILANRCYAYVPTCLAGISFGTLLKIACLYINKYLCDN